MRYAVDLRHTLQAPCGDDGSSSPGHEKRYIQSSRPWECGNPEGISKECGKGGKPVSWLSALSILCHFHGLLFARQLLDESICSQPTQSPAPATRYCWSISDVNECIGDLAPTEKTERLTDDKRVCRHKSETTRRNSSQNWQVLSFEQPRHQAGAAHHHAV
jgi:hypothetical protein